MEDKELWILIALFGGIFGFALIVKLAMWLNDFSGELKYLNSEIGRTDGSEQRYWIRQKRRLWLSIIPFVRYRIDD